MRIPFKEFVSKEGSPYSKAIANCLLFLLCLLPLAWPALLNGYPLIYSDTGAYLLSGHMGSIPVDRPIIYGFLVRHISMSYTLWFQLVFQAMVLTLVLMITCKSVMKSTKIMLTSFIAIAILSVTTGLSYYTGFIMPDLFSAINILCLGVLAVSKTLRFNVWTITVLILCVFSNICHLSNMATTTIVIGLLITASLFWRLGDFFAAVRSRRWLLIAIAILPWMLLPTINYSIDGRFRLSDSGNSFLMARLAESDILRTYLDENCETLDFSLCGKQDELPKYAYQFLWQEDSPFYCTDSTEVIHWEDCWRNRNKEYGPVIIDILTTPKHLGQFLLMAVSETGRQLSTFHNGHLIPMMEGSAVIGSIKWHYPDDYETYISSTQSKQGYASPIINRIQPFAIAISFILVLIMAGNKKLRNEIDNRLWLLLLVVIFGLLANAFVCASFSNVVERYQGRVIWLLPFIAILMFFSRKNWLRKH